jgi:hypothetical protein
MSIGKKSNENHRIRLRIYLAENAEDAEGAETIINNSHNLSVLRVLCVKSSMGFGFVKIEFYS